jgi:hypothetical protein
VNWVENVDIVSLSVNAITFGGVVKIAAESGALRGGEFDMYSKTK